MEDLFQHIRPILSRTDAGILKTSNAYIDREKKSILLEALTIEGESKKSFMILLGSRPDGFVVRLYPGTEVERTDMVKRLLAEQAKQIMEALPRLQIGETNLSEYLEK
jgi:hypothetical protein